MKYNIYTNQLVLSDTNLDIIDGAILDYLHDLCDETNSAILVHRIKNKQGIWTWVNYSALIAAMPLLHFSKKSISSIAKRIIKISEAGFIDCLRDDSTGKLYLKFKDGMAELLFETSKYGSGTIGSRSTTSKSRSRAMDNIYNNNNIYKNKKENNIKEKRKEIAPLTDMRLWEIAMKKNVSLKDVKRIHEAALDDMNGKNKYKNTDLNLTVQKWVDLGLKKYKLKELNEIERMDLETDRPDLVEKRRKRAEVLVEEGIL